jgi:2'-5' RNA ligase
MRLFVAVNFSDETRTKLVALCNELRGTSTRGRFTLPENLHLTLAFLGECDAKKVVAIKTCMDDVKFEPFDLMIDCIGRFKRNGGDIWWAGVRENKKLLELHQKLTAGLNASGFVCEERKYSPHITLGREIVTKAQPRQIEPFGETVSKIDLMKSERIAGKLTYTSIYRRTGDNNATI